MTNQFLVEFNSTDGVTNTTQRFATGRGFKTQVSETPSDTVYLPLVVDAGSIETHLFDFARTQGFTSTGAGDVILNNAGGRLNFLKNLGLDGQTILMRESLTTSLLGRNYPDDFPVRFTGAIDTREFPNTQVRLRVRSKLIQAFAKQYQTVKYLGDNVGPNDLEGTAADLKGKPKPKLKGGVSSNVPPVLVNFGGDIYQISSDEVGSIDTVYDGRSIVALDTIHPTLAAFQAASPNAGEYDAYLGDNTEAVGSNERGCYIRLGTTATFDITCDVTEDTTVANNTTAQVVSRILAEQGFILDSTSVTELDAVAPEPVEIWQGIQERTVGDIINEVLPSVSAFLYDTVDGTFIIGRLELPTTPEVVKTVTKNILLGKPKIKAITSRDPDKGIPINRVNLGYQKNYFIVNDRNRLAGGSEDDLPFTELEFRTASDDNAAVLDKHLNSPERDIETHLTNETDGDTQATHVLSLFEEQREFLQIRIPAELAFRDDKTSLELNDVIRLEGKIYRIMSKFVRFPVAKNRGQFSAASVGYLIWGGVDG